MTVAAAPKPRANVLEVAVFRLAWAGWQSRRFWRLFLTRETQSGAEGTAVQTLARNLDSLGLHGVFTAARRATGHWELRAQGVPLSGVFVPHLPSTG